VVAKLLQIDFAFLITLSYPGLMCWIYKYNVFSYRLFNNAYNYPFTL